MKVYMSHEKNPLTFHYTALRLHSAKRKNGGWKATFLLEGDVDFFPQMVIVMPSKTWVNSFNKNNIIINIIIIVVNKKTTS